MTFALNPALDTGALARRFAERGRLSIPDILAPESATALHQHLRERGDWLQVINSGDKLFELDRTTRAEMPADQLLGLDDAVYAGARYGFQYRYESLRVPDDEPARAALNNDLLARFASWWSSGAARDFLRAVTGAPDMAFADAQATAYSPGDFLTGHDDAVAGKGRIAAYVLNLTPQWRTEWGGLLVFPDAEGSTAEAFIPGFNRLSLLRVPQPHSVSEVSRAAAFRRYAITGWLRR